jgi:hypothetical protein
MRGSTRSRRMNYRYDANDNYAGCVQMLNAFGGK